MNEILPEPPSQCPCMQHILSASSQLTYIQHKLQLLNHSFQCLLRSHAFSEVWSQHTSELLFTSTIVGSAPMIKPLTFQIYSQCPRYDSLSLMQMIWNLFSYTFSCCSDAKVSHVKFLLSLIIKLKVLINISMFYRINYEDQVPTRSK